MKDQKDVCLTVRRNDKAHYIYSRPGDADQPIRLACRQLKNMNGAKLAFFYELVTEYF